MDHASLDQLGGPKGVSADPPYVGPMAHNCPHLSLSVEKFFQVQVELVIDKICPCYVILPLIPRLLTVF